ncbi:MAG: hypothetical protein BKP49_08710 [Treponema sp. CETP13]|nr:MAG: hypothetical protein BKP49_08710 [Treponema sp. CETP13]
MNKYDKQIGLIFFLWCFLAVLPAKSFENEQKIYSSSDDVYSDIEILYIASGISLPSSSGPWSSGELRDMVELIDIKNLSGSMRALYRSICDQLYEEQEIIREETLAFSSDIIFAPEVYAQTNSDDFDSESDWNYGYEERSAMLNIPLEGWFSSIFYMRSDLSLGIDSGGIDSEDKDTSDDFYSTMLASNLYPVFPASVSNLNANFPFRSSVSFGGNHWNIALGRDTVEWGVGESGNLTFGGNMKYENYLRYSAYYDTFKFTTLSVFYPHPETVDGGSDQNSLYTGLKFFLAHRIEFKAFDNKLSLALSEAIMYQSADNTIDLSFYNPANVFHNYFIRANANSLISLDWDYAITAGWTTYGQFLVDEYHVPGEPDPNDGEDGAYPDAWGALAGVKNTRAFRQGILKNVFEVVLASPYLYLRESYEDGEEGKYGVSFYGDYRDYTSDGIEYNSYCTGYAYGGDCLTCTLKSTYIVPDKWSAGAELFYMIHGIIDSDEAYHVLTGGESIASFLATYYPDYTGNEDWSEEKYTTGELEYTVRSSILGSRQVKENLKVYGNLDFYLIKNKDNEASDWVSDVQLVLGAKYLF